MKNPFLFIFVYFAIPSSAVPYGPTIRYRDVTAGSGINTTVEIRDHEGVDITSSFKIMIYQETKVRSNGELNDRSTVSRPITECNINSTFMSSYCTPQHNTAYSLQRYTIICLQPVPYFDNHQRLIGINKLPMLRSGHCHHDEVCLNGLGPGSAKVQGRQWANCVQKSVFDDTMYGQNSQTAKDIVTVLDGPARSAYMVMSKLDGATPMEADTFDIMSWIEDVIGVEDNKVKESKCRDCMDLKADRFEANTKVMKAQATLLTAGAMAGILWMGVLSG